ncbi:MAG: replication initiator protein A [Sulfuricella sp.]|nr:replication initiator protein A [Sulfuricella sp.]
MNEQSDPPPEAKGGLTKGADLLAKVEQMEKNARARKFSTEVIQLPLWDDRVRGLPNALARSALFTSANRNEARDNYTRHPITAVNGVEIYYTGTELRQDDLDVFLQVIHLARTMPLGEIVEFSGYSLLRALGWNPSKENYTRLKGCIDRLSANTVHVHFNDGDEKRGYGGSMFRKFAWDENAKKGSSQRWKIWLEKEIVGLFGDRDYTKIDWEQRLQLPPLAKWLHQFYFTHKEPFGYKAETIKGLCGSRIKELSKFRYKLKEALKTLVDVGFLDSWAIDRKTDVVLVKRTDRKRLSACH